MRSHAGRRTVALSAALLVAWGLASLSSSAQHAGARSFTVEQILGLPTPDNLVASPVGSTIAWTFNERGVRNIYAAAADAGDFKARRLTPYTEDDGQELTNLSFSSDGKTIVYVRGGDHGSNRPADAPNPSGSPVQPKVQVWSVAVTGAEPKLLGDGDDPAIAPDGTRVAFVKDRRIWIVPIDGSKPTGGGIFRARDEPVAVVVARRPDTRVRVEPRRSRLHRTVRGRPADPLSRAVHVARFIAGMVARRTEDRVSTTTRSRWGAEIAADPDPIAVGDPGRRDGCSRSRRPRRGRSVHGGHQRRRADRSHSAEPRRHRLPLGGRRHPGLSVVPGRMAPSVFGPAPRLTEAGRCC